MPRVMEFQLLHQASGLGWLKHLVESRQGMGVQVIHDQHELVGSRIVDIHQLANEEREIPFGALLGHLQIALARPSVHRPRKDYRCPAARTHSRSIPSALVASARGRASRSPTACWFRPGRSGAVARRRDGCRPSAPPPVFQTNSAVLLGGIHHCLLRQRLRVRCVVTPAGWFPARCSPRGAPAPACRQASATSSVPAPPLAGCTSTRSNRPPALHPVCADGACEVDAASGLRSLPLPQSTAARARPSRCPPPVPR